MTRDRNCTDGNPGDIGCLGSANESSECNTQLCPIWDAWTAWTACDAPCGNGTMTRDRNCTNGSVGDDGCIGDRNETLTCNTVACTPINGGYSAWSAWGPCSHSCSTAGPSNNWEFPTTTRTRSCNNPAPANGGATCDGAGPPTQTYSCNSDINCPI